MLLREWRKMQGLTLDQAATRLSVTHAHLSRVERGQSVPSLELIARVHVLTDGEVSANDWLAAFMKTRAPAPQAVAA